MRASAFTAAKVCLAGGCLAAAAALSLPVPRGSSQYVAAHDARRAARARMSPAPAGLLARGDETSARLSDLFRTGPESKAPQLAAPLPASGASGGLASSIPPAHRLAAGDQARAPLSGLAQVPAVLEPPGSPKVTFRVAEPEPPAGLVPEPTPDPVLPPSTSETGLAAEVRALREEVVRLAQANGRPAGGEATSDELRRLTEELRSSERFRRLEDQLRSLQSGAAGQTPVPSAPPAPAPSAPAKASPVLPAPAPVVRAMPSDSGEDKFSLQVEAADVTQVLDLVGQMAGWNVVTASGVSGQVTLNLRDVTLDQALDAILTPRKLVAEKRDGLLFVLPAADAAAARLNRSQAGTSRLLVTKVYRPVYIGVEDLRKLITPLLTFGNNSTLSTTSDRTEQAAGGTGGVVAPDLAGLLSLTQAGASAGQSSTATKSTFTSEEKTGAVADLPQGDVLVVQDYPDVIEEIDKVLLEVDVPPLQVVIEAVILRVTLDDSMKLGVNFSMLRNSGQDLVVSGNGPGSAKPIETAIASVAGLRYGFLHGDVSGFIEALETIAETSLVASPSLRVLNRQEAELIIGKELGYKTQTFLNQQTIESVQFLEVGTKLTIKPYAAPDGLIRMEVHPEKSSGTVDGNGLPQTDTTAVTTNVMVRDGSTVVIGGLIDEQTEESLSQIPLLGSIPVIGYAFRNTDEKLVRSELIVLITPRIVCDPVEEARGEVLRSESEQRAAYFSDNLSPVSRQNLGRMHVERAEELYQKGRLAEAFDHVNEALAIHKNDGEALRLKNVIERAMQARRRGFFGLPVDRAAGRPPGTIEFEASNPRKGRATPASATSIQVPPATAGPTPRGSVPPPAPPPSN